MANRRSNNRTRGGKQRGENKAWEYFECAVPTCGKKRSKRKTVLIGNDKAGKPIRVCKAHNVKANSPGVKTHVGK